MKVYKFQGVYKNQFGVSKVVDLPYTFTSKKQAEAYAVASTVEFYNQDVYRWKLQSLVKVSVTEDHRPAKLFNDLIKKVMVYLAKQ